MHKILVWSTDRAETKKIMYNRYTDAVQDTFTLQNQISKCSLDNTANRILSLLQITWTSVPAACAEANTFGHPSGKYIVIAPKGTDPFGDPLAIY